MAGFRPELLVCFKTVDLDQARLLDLRVPLKVHYSPDDVSNPVNVSPDYLQHEAAWDLVVTTKSYNVAEVRARSGARSVFVWSAFDPAWHHRAARRGDERLVGFIGNWRPDRQALVERLHQEHGSSFLLAGEGCGSALARAAPSRPPPGRLRCRVLARGRADTSQGHVLLNSDNRDLHTCRSLEVPAAGGLVVGERTVEHQALLDEGTECLLWDSPEELDDHLRRLASEPATAERLALAGWRRIRSSGHRYVDRAREIGDALGVAPLPGGRTWPSSRADHRLRLPRGDGGARRPPRGACSEGCSWRRPSTGPSFASSAGRRSSCSCPRRRGSTTRSPTRAWWWPARTRAACARCCPWS